MKKSRTTFLEVIIVILIGVSAITVLILVAHRNGSSGVIKSAIPPLSASSQVDAKQNVQKDLTVELEKVKTVEGLTFLAKAGHDACDAGQHNYERNDDYSLRCIYKETYFFGFNENFRTMMMKYDGTLRAASWNNAVLSMNDLMTHYYDKYYGPNNPQPSNFPHGYLVSDIPDARYKKNNMKLYIEYAEGGTEQSYFHLFETSQLVYGGMVTLETEDKQNLIDVRQLYRQTMSNYKYMIAVSTEKIYFQK